MNLNKTIITGTISACLLLSAGFAFAKDTTTKPAADHKCPNAAVEHKCMEQQVKPVADHKCTNPAGEKNCPNEKQMKQDKCMEEGKMMMCPMMKKMMQMHEMEKCMNHPKLTPDQEKKMEELKKDFAAKVAPVKKNLAQLEYDLKGLMMKDTPDEKAIETKITEIGKVRTDMQILKFHFKMDMHKILKTK